MKELIEIMDKFSKTEYDINALENVLKTMEMSCVEEEQLETGYVINVVLRNIKTLKEDIHNAVGELDMYIAEEE